MDEKIDNILFTTKEIKKGIEEIKIKNNNLEENIKKIKPILNRIENRGKIIDIQICNRDKLLIELTKEIARLRNIIEKDLYDKINILFDVIDLQYDRFYNFNYELNIIKKEMKQYKNNFK